MRIARRNFGLLLLLGGLVAIDFALREPSAGVRVGEPVLAGFDPAAVAGIRIARGADVLDLELGPAGWTVKQRLDFPAYATRIEDLLLRLARLGSDSIVSAEADSHDLFGFDDPTRLVLTDSAGRVLHELDLGVPRDESTGAYVRIAGRDAVFRAAGIDAVEPRPMLWVDAHVMDLEIPSVTALRAAFADGVSFELIKAESGRWAAVGAGRDLAAARVDPLLLVADTLYFEDVTDATPDQVGLDVPLLRLRFTLEGGRSLRFDLGGPIGATRAATRPDWSTPWVVRIPSSSAARLEAVAREIAAQLD